MPEQQRVDTSGSRNARSSARDAAATDPPATVASAFTPPSISLPTGGGAIRGIGEKFETNAANGTGTLSVPLGLSAARSGFHPQLSLSYDSGAGNGPFGMGWSLSLAAITRKTDKGLPRYRPEETAECDVFVLSGAEELVPVLLQDEQGEWHTDEFEHAGHRIKRYRPRIEGLFARIERWTRLEDEDEHWRSLSRDNILTVYGRSPESRIADPRNPSRVFSWLLCASYDDTGNAIVYDYVAENEAGVDAELASEHNRLRTANRYLKTVRYGNRQPVLLDLEAPGFRGCHLDADADAADWMFQAVFDYGEGHYFPEESGQGGERMAADSDTGGLSCVRCLIPADPSRRWPVREDPFSTYRAGFEVRTYRLCQRVLMVHHFPDEAVGAHCLVSSTELQYQPKKVGSFITAVTQSGYARRADGRYLKRSLPPLELEYTSSPLGDERYRYYQVREVDTASVDNLPAGIDGDNYEWLDLFGEGISGVLNRRGSDWYYKHNNGRGQFGPTQLIATLPSIAAGPRGKTRLLDVEGDGVLELVMLDASLPGFQRRTAEGGWGGFRNFRSLPTLDFNAPNLRFIDVTGDGIADILITEDDALTWHPSLLAEGFGSAIRVSVPSDENAGPHVIFDDGIQSIYLADMSGDGLTDLVRIRNGEICYFPNEGYGHFGRKVVMDNAPWFEDDDLFEQSRVKLADTDGSGTTDIVYLASDGIRIYLNLSGNGWSDARVLPDLPPANQHTAVSVVDFLGRGTACLLWSSTLPADTRRPLRYVDLMDGQKPHLLVVSRNNVGAETRVEYASSTEFYLADKAAGSPWITRLPFPVHVVKRMQVDDRISGNRFSSSYTYHHGFFDSVEREFRGFARVDQLDTEELALLNQPGALPPASNVNPASNVPPVLTKTWFHTGVFLGNARVSRHLAHEYYYEPEVDARSAMLLPDSVLPDTETAPESREACRALKGTVLRKEVYALDDADETARPYSVAESNSTVVYLQPRRGNLHAVFFTHSREVLTVNYERKLYEVEGALRADPRVGHSAVLETDDYGNTLRSASIGYGRRYADSCRLLTAADRAKQQQILLTYTETDYTNPILGLHAYRTPAAAQIRTYELIHVVPSGCEPGVTPVFGFDELRRQIARASDGCHDLPYEDVDARGAATVAPYRRLIEESRSYYRADDLDRLLPLGELQPLALPGQTYKLAFTPGLLREVYRRDDPSEPLMHDSGRVLEQQGRYARLEDDGRWWIASGRVFYTVQECGPGAELEHARRHFFLPQRFLDPFGHSTLATYDRYDLMAVEVRDPIGNSLTSEIDYRVMATVRTTDANRNRSHVAFDVFGRVVGTAVMGKQGQQDGDSLDGFVADLDERTILDHLSDPLRDPQAVLQLATTRIVYDLWAYVRSRDSAHPQPVTLYTLARETHAADLGRGKKSRIQHAFSYSDGFGRAIQKKLQSAPGPLFEGGPKLDSRWLGTGWTLFNNKGKPVREYEPFFTDSHRFELARTVGVSSITCYDPLSRVVARIHPNHTYEKVIFEPWRLETWDVNDTVLQADPTLDPDVGDFFRCLPQSDFLPSWHTQRIHGELGQDEEAAARKSAAHANTPHLSCYDSLGRMFLSIDHNSIERDGSPVEEFFATRTKLDIEGNHRAMIDALGRVALQYDYDMLGTRIRMNSMDAGMRWALNDVIGHPLLTWDSRGFRVRHEYDALHRPTDLYVHARDAAEILAERVQYGEGQPNDLALNLRAKPFREFDSAGVTTHERYDFKGNLLQTSRQLLQEYRDPIDWSQDLQLCERRFVKSTTFDALNRVLTLTNPDCSVARPLYNEANQLKSLGVNVRGAAEANEFVTYVNYNSKGQRQVIDYGNGVRTHYEYDPLTFRLVELSSRRKKERALLQDLHYAFDPVGNITSIRDAAQQTFYFQNQVVSPGNDYVYDAVYRLIATQGREHAGVLLGPKDFGDDSPRADTLFPSDGHALRRYRERFNYDAVGNILELLHSTATTRWSRQFSYADRSDRLSCTRIGAEVERYAHDAAGNMTRMPHLDRMAWDFKDQLCCVRRQVVQHGEGETTYYVYNSEGERIRKVTERASGSLKSERAYLGGFEVYREYDSVGRCVLERETLHILDDQHRIALLETLTIEDGERVECPATLQRLQLANQIESSAIELDAAAAVISYEEYYSYGGTSYRATDRHVNAARKRYRYTGKEHDDESGFYYHGARYYAPWIARWVSADPTGMRDGTNLYPYCANNPITHSDPSGTGPPKPDPYFLKSGGAKIIGDAEGYGHLWKESVNKVLGPGKEFGENIAKFREDILKLAADQKTLGSNKAKGTAINVARETYKKVRRVYGKALKKAGVSLKGFEIHHGLNNHIAKKPEEALEASDLFFAEGHAASPGSEHNKLHKLDEKLEGDLKKLESKGKNAEQAAAGEAKAAGAEATKTAAGEGKEAVKVAAKEAESTAAKTGLKEAVSVGEKTGLKTGAKFVGKKVAKFIPFVGIAVGVGLVANDLRKGDIKSAAWDTAEAIPVVGDVVGAAHLGIEAGTALNEGLGIDKVAAEHGEAVEHAATALGISKDTAVILGATGAALSSITVAPQIALNRTISRWFQ